MTNRVIEDGIRFLIGDHGKVVIPNIGVFIGRYVSAHFDPIEGNISPPTLSIQMLEDKDEHPTLLIEYVAEKLECSYRDAEIAIEQYCGELQQKLKSKEIINLLGIGRLYFDFQDKLKFVQDNGNQLFQSFGLPILEFLPIERSENRLSAIAARLPLGPRKRKQSLGKRIRKQVVAKDFLPISIGLGAFVVILSLFLIVPKQKFDFSAELADKRVKPERINQKPAHGLDAELAKVKLTEEEIRAAEEELTKEVEAVLDTKKATDSKTKAASTEQSVIIVGVYGQPEGIRERRMQIEKMGHNFYSERAGELTRVGLIVAHSSPQELIDVLQEVKSTINPKAWIQ